jgi:hypothetical protein
MPFGYTSRLKTAASRDVGIAPTGAVELPPQPLANREIIYGQILRIPLKITFRFVDECRCEFIYAL